LTRRSFVEQNPLIERRVMGSAFFAQSSPADRFSTTKNGHPLSIAVGEKRLTHYLFVCFTKNVG
jgi:hypothetical protein